MNVFTTDYLNTLVDWGLVGASLVASAWVLLYWGVLKTWRTVRGSRDDFARKKSSKLAFLIGASVGLLAILVHSVVDFQMHLPGQRDRWPSRWMAGAVLSSQWRFATGTRFWFRAGTGLKCLGTSAVLLAGNGLPGATKASRRAAEVLLAATGARPMTLPWHNHYSHAKIAALEHAAQIEPMNPRNPL